MLTTTYALAVISIEQQQIRNALSQLGHCLHGGLRELARANMEDLRTVHDLLIGFDNAFRLRKVEMHIVPAIREVMSNASGLLGELKALSDEATSALESMCTPLLPVLFCSRSKAAALALLVERYCQSLLKRLAKEEEQLLPLARRLLSEHEWFVIAVNCLPDQRTNRARECCPCASRPIWSVRLWSEHFGQGQPPCPPGDRHRRKVGDRRIR